MPHTPGHRPTVGQAWQSSRLAQMRDGGRYPQASGLLGRGPGRALFGPNLPQDGVGLGPGRNTLIAGPTQAAVAAMGSAVNRSGPPKVWSPPPRTFTRGDTKISDLLKNAQFGTGPGQTAFGTTSQFPNIGKFNAAGGYGQFGPAQQPPQPGAAQGPQGPENILAPSQGFFSRMVGEKGSGQRSDIGRSLMAAGAQMMKGSKEGTFATIGEGLTTGLEAYDEAKGMRAWEEDRGFAAEERARDAEDRANKQRVNKKITEITGGWDENTTPEQKVSDYQRAFNTAIGNGDHALAGRIREMAAYLSEGPEAGPAVRYKTWDQTEGRAPDGTTPTRVREVEAGAPGTISDRQYFDKDLYLEQIGEGVDPAEAARNSWRTGGMIVDPVAARATADKEVTLSTQEKLNARLGEAAYDGLMLMVVDPATVDPETGETIPGQPNYADYYMAGATPLRNPLTGAITAWEQGSPGTKEGWQSFLASLISNAGSETSGFGAKLLGFFGRSVFLKDNPEILAGYTNALNYINPTVRFLSGAQMTNQEAMRYYNALIPAPGDPIEVIELKRRKRDVLTNAMGGPGISDAARQKTRKDLGLDEDELMVHEHGAFGGDASGRDAADYYLARLTRLIGVTDMTDYGAVSGQVDDTLYTDDDDDPGAFVRPPGGG